MPSSYPGKNSERVSIQISTHVFPSTQGGFLEHPPHFGARSDAFGGKTTQYSIYEKAKPLDRDIGRPTERTNSLQKKEQGSQVTSVFCFLNRSINPFRPCISSNRYAFGFPHAFTWCAMCHSNLLQKHPSVGPRRISFTTSLRLGPGNQSKLECERRMELRH